MMKVEPGTKLELCTVAGSTTIAGLSPGKPLIGRANTKLTISIETRVKIIVDLIFGMISSSPYSPHPSKRGESQFKAYGIIFARYFGLNWALSEFACELRAKVDYCFSRYDILLLEIYKILT
jgi:hypothetical protein